MPTGVEYLKGAKGAPNAYDHVATTILKVLSDSPGGAHQLFEHLSHGVKDQGSTAGLSVDEQLALYLKDAAASTAEQKRDAAEYLSGANSLFPVKIVGEEPAEPQEPPPMQDFILHASYFEWAGVGFGTQESYRIHLSLKKLALDLTAKEKPIDGLRFWGKILGTGEDYYIAETGPGESPDDDSETADALINDYSYHVCSAPGSAWVTLPSLTSAQVVGARALRRFFSGDLEAQVPGNPPFPGVEKNLLRATIGEIAAATVVVPKGFYLRDDDEGLKMEASEEEAPVMSTAQMLDPISWQHKHLEINSWGRTVRLPEAEDEDGNPIKSDEPEQKQALRSIEDDEAADKVWNVRLHSGIVAVRNLQYPGSCTVAIPTSSLNSTPAAPGEAPLGPIQFSSIYVGYGMKATSKSFTPKMPAAIGGECEMPEEASDVLVEPVKAEEDDE